MRPSSGAPREGGDPPCAYSYLVVVHQWWAGPPWLGQVRGRARPRTTTHAGPAHPVDGILRDSLQGKVVLGAGSRVRALAQYLLEVLPGVWAAVLVAEESPPDDGPYGP